MRVLIVDDDQSKIRQIIQVLKAAGVEEDDIEAEGAVLKAIERLKQTEFNLLVLDLVLPIRLSEDPSSSGGLRLLTEIGRRQDLKRPEHIVGITVDEEALGNAKPEFNRGLWTIARFGTHTSEWKEAIAEKVRYLAARERARSSNITAGCDVLFVCALRRPELSQLMDAIPVEWSQIQCEGDHTRYFEGHYIISGGKSLRLIACSAPLMGLTASASLASKAIHQFRPKIVSMTGICAGRRGEVKLGECIVASTTWDYGSGKFEGGRDNPRFLANPYQLPVDPRIQSTAEAVLSSQKRLDDVQDLFKGNKPDTRLSGRVAPLASGAAVQAYKEFFEAIVAQQMRKVVAIDMEAFAVCWASREAAEPKPIWLVSKSVSDFADEEKRDDIQEYCSFTSARIAFEITLDLLDPQRHK